METQVQQKNNKKDLIILAFVMGSVMMLGGFLYYQSDSFSSTNINPNNIKGFLQQGHTEGDKIFIVNNSQPQWNIIKHRGNEANFKLILTDLKDKKTDICFVLKDGVNVGDVDTTDKFLYNEDGSKIQDDKAKDIVIKYETAKCDGQDGYHLSLTEAQAINIDEYIKLGDESTVLIYQPTNQVLFSISENLNVTSTLYWDVYGDKSDWNNTVNDVFVSFDNERYKFGANHEGIVWERYKYVLESEAPLENRNGKYYFRIGSGGYKVLTNDICSKINPLTNETADCQFNSYSTFNDITNRTTHTLEIEFYSDSFIDPEFTFENLETESTLNNIRFEGDNSSHIEITDIGIYNSTLLYLPFDVNVSQTTVYDYSNNDNDGTIMGNASFEDEGLFGGSFNFSNGVQDFISFGSVPDLETGLEQITISVWAKFPPAPASSGTFVRKLRGVGTGQFFLRQSASTGASFGLRTTSFDTLATSSGLLDVDVWNHIVGTWNGTNRSIYINGVVQASDTKTGTLDTDTDVLTIGCFDNSGDGDCDNVAQESFIGEMDELMILNASLNASDVLTLFNNQSSRFKSIGIQEIKETNLTLGVDNKINLTITSFQNLQSSNLSARIASWNVSNGYNLTDPNLVAYWGLNNQSDLGENSTHVLDQTNNGNNGTVFGAVVNDTFSIFHSAFTFDGIDDYIDVGTIDFTSFTAVSYSLWYQYNDQGPRIISSNFAGNDDVRIFMDSNNVIGAFDDGTVSQVIISNPDTTAFHHIVLTNNGTEVNMYLDGVAGTPGSDPGFNFAGMNGLTYIGRQAVGSGFFNGTIDEVMIYNRSLSATEVKSLFVKGLPSYTYTDSQNITAENTNFTFDIVPQQENVFPELTYFPTLSSPFYSPVLIGNVIIDSFSGEVAPDSCTYGGSGDFVVQCSDNCKITTSIDVDGDLIIKAGSGTFEGNGNINYTSTDQEVIIGMCTVAGFL